MFTIKTKSGIKAEISQEAMSDYKRKKGWNPKKDISFDDLIPKDKDIAAPNPEECDATDAK